MKHEYKDKREPAEGFVHTEYDEPRFDDKYYRVALDEHRRIRNARKSKKDNTFECRVRQWKLGDDNAPKLRFLMISGIVHSCNYFNPLVKCMSIEDTFKGFSVEIYAIDIPGHGASQTPPNIKFGMLRLEDYVDVILQIMDILKNQEGVEKFDYVVAHSMGGMLAMLVEKELNEKRTSLLEKYETQGVILLASALPEAIDWQLGEGIVSEYGVPLKLFSLLLPFVTFSPRYLLHGHISNEDFVKQFFGILDDDSEKTTYIVPGAPVGDAVSVLNSPESYIALSELAGLDFETRGVLKRPHIKKGLFSNYTLGVAGYTNDILFRPEEEEALFGYLSTNRRRIYKTIGHDFAVHDDAYSYPCASLQLIMEIVTLSSP